MKDFLMRRSQVLGTSYLVASTLGTRYSVEERGKILISNFYLPPSNF
jgi:hypothetical protein